MSKYIEIDQFTGPISNADLGDIPKETPSSLQNMKAKYGKLMKTFGFGDRLAIMDVIESGNWDDSKAWTDHEYWVESAYDTEIGESIKNMFVFVHPNLSDFLTDGVDHVTIVVIINSSTNVVTLKYWDDGEWKNINTLLKNTLGTFYHKYAKNPIIHADNMLRILPGNVSGGQPIWIGYIDRDYFDGLYIEGTDYDKGFFAYNSQLTKPNIASLSASGSAIAGGAFAAAESGDTGSKEYWYYKLAFLYDGVQESLLSEDPIIVEKSTSEFHVRLAFSMIATSFNKRITGINVYRSDSINGTYYRIQTVELTRDTGKAHTGTDGAYTGDQVVYLPDLEYELDLESHTYKVHLAHKVGPGYWTIGTIASQLNSTTLVATTTAWADVGGETVDYGFWNCDWRLYEDDVKVAEGGTDEGGGFAGEDVAIILDYDSTGEGYEGSVILLDNSSNMILENYGHAFLCYVHWSTKSDVSWKLAKMIDGSYLINWSGGIATYNFFDNNLTDGEEHPYQGEPSINVNGQYAVIVKELLCLADIVLDPGGENESHDDWGAFSYPECYDAIPVSRVKACLDREGGPITGIGSSFGSPMIFKKHAIFKMDIVDLIDMSTWGFKEARFNRGNLAPNGLAQSGHRIAMPSYDGIYVVDANLVAAADETPLIENRISEPINDKYLALDPENGMPNIIGIYDEAENEFIFQFPNGEVWSFDIVEQAWEQKLTSHYIDIASKDFDGRALIYNENTQTLYSTFARESVIAGYKSKRFRVSSKRKEPVRILRVKYKSAVPLRVNMYVDGVDDIPVRSKPLPASIVETTKGVALRKRCMDFILEIRDEVKNKSYWEIYGIEVDPTD